MSEFRIKTLEEIKDDHIKYVLMMTDYNQKDAAEILNVSVKHIQNFVMDNSDVRAQIDLKKRINSLKRSEKNKIDPEIFSKFRPDSFVETGYKDPSPEERDHWYNKDYH